MMDAKTTGEIDALTGYVLDQAREKAARTIAQAKKKAEQVLKEAQVRAKEREEELVHAGMVDVERTRRQIISQAQLRFKGKLLEERANILERVLTEVRGRLERICAEDTERYLAFLIELLEGTLAGEKVDHVVIYLSERDAKSYEKELSSTLAAKPNLNKVEIRTSKISGGVIVEFPEEHLQIDASLNEILREAIPEIEQLVEKEIFLPKNGDEEKQDGK